MRGLSGQPSAPHQLGSQNAGSSLKLEITCLDDEDQPFAPATMTYRIDNLSCNLEMLPWTGIVDPAAVQNIIIPVAINTIVRQWDDFETLQVTVAITSVEGETQQQIFVYQLTNISQGRLVAGP